MPADVLGHGMQDDIAAVLKGAAKRRRRYRVINDHGHAMRMRHIGDRCHIRDIAGRVAYRLAENGGGLAVDQLCQVVPAVVFGEAHINAELGQHVPEERPGSAVELRHGDDIVAGFGQIEDGIMNRGLPGSERQRSDAAFHRRHALFQHIAGGVHDAGIYVARHGQIE